MAAFVALWWEVEAFAGVLVGGTMALGGLFVLLAHDDTVLPQSSPVDDDD